MKFTSYKDLIASPWKNGGGITRELACYPPGASFDGFLWRVSIAEVSQSGPFSRFSGIDRVITLLRGAGMKFVFDDGKITPLITPLTPYQFAGEVGLDAQLIGGVCEDFNLMLRRGAVSGEVTVLQTASTLGEKSDFLLLFSARGRWEITAANGEVFTLEPQQTLSEGASIDVMHVRPLGADSALISVKIMRENRIEVNASKLALKSPPSTMKD